MSQGLHNSASSFAWVLPHAVMLKRSFGVLSEAERPDNISGASHKSFLLAKSLSNLNLITPVGVSGVTTINLFPLAFMRIHLCA